MLGIFSKTKDKKSEIQYSKYFPDKFYSHKLVIIDDSLEYFIRNANIEFPKIPLIISEISQWSIEQDEFEEIRFGDTGYKLIYDVTNSIFYLCKEYYKGKEQYELEADELQFINNTYVRWSGTMEIKDKNELLSIYSRNISEEADEYCFVELNKTFTQTIYCGIIVQPSMIF